MKPIEGHLVNDMAINALVARVNALTKRVQALEDAARNSEKKRVKNHYCPGGGEHVWQEGICKRCGDVYD